MALAVLQLPALGGENTSIFDMPAFFVAWREILGDSHGIRVPFREGLVCAETSKFGGLLKLREMRVAGWPSSWFQDLHADRLAGFLEASDKTPWDVFRLITSADREELQQFPAMEEAGYRVLEAPVPPHYQVDLDQGWDAYLHSRSRNVRQNLARSRQRAARLSPHRVFYYRKNEVDQFLDDFFVAHIRYWHEKIGRSVFDNPLEQEFTRTWLKTLHATGNLILDAYMLDGKIANLSASVRQGDALYILLSINTGRHLDCSPGILALYRRLEDAACSGINRVYLGFGNQFYKVQAASQIVERRELLVANPNSKLGGLYAAYLENRLHRFYQSKPIPTGH